MTPLFSQNNLAIFGYGALLTDPGEKIARHVIACIPQTSPWPIEYARRGRLRYWLTGAIDLCQAERMLLENAAGQ